MPRPQFVSCPLCKQGFGHASINIHIPQCYEKALKRWKLTRDGPRPVMPPLVDVGSLPSSRRGSVSPSRRGSKARSSFSAEQPAGSSVTAVRAIKRSSVVDGAVASPDSNGVLKPCAKCGRTFTDDRIEYHESVCIAGQHRASFDSSRQRASVDESSGFNYSARPLKTKKQRRGGSMGGYTNDSDPSRVPQTNWREAHEDFVAAIRQARRQSVGPAGRSTSRSAPRQPTVGAPRRQPPSNDNADKILVVNPGSAQIQPIPPLKKATVPRSMARYNQTLKERQQEPRRTSTIEALGQGRRRSINEVLNYATGASKGAGDTGADGPRYIVNDNTSSIGMLQAFGQA